MQQSGIPVNAKGLSKGAFQTAGLHPDTEYVIKVFYQDPTGLSLVVGQTIVRTTSTGQLIIASVLIDPFGTITDAVTKKTIEGAQVKLIYADTAKNRAAGKVPGQLVELPSLAGFPPSGNQNPQLSDALGKYAYMVFPETDYQILASKSGYLDYVSPIISVYADLVQFDFEMTPVPAVAADTTATPAATTTQAAATIPVPKTGEQPMSASIAIGIGMIVLAMGLWFKLRRRSQRQDK